MAYGTVKIKEVIALIDKELGTDWKIGTAPEVVASLESAGDVTLTGILHATNLGATAAAPGTQTASTVVIGQKDSSVGTKATLDVETEEVVVTEASTPDSTLAVWVNGVEYKIPLQAV